jgi:uncharacterized protein YndB with AHSA1/START domain
MMKITAPKGISYDLGGVFREVKPPEKLVFTWNWKKNPATPGEPSESGETLLTVEFFERGKETEVVLTHELHTGGVARESYDRGWKGCFDMLAIALAKAT